MNKIVIAFSSIALLSFGLIYFIDQHPLQAYTITVREYERCIQDIRLDVQINNRIPLNEQAFYEEFWNLIEAKERDDGRGNPSSCKQFQLYIQKTKENPSADINYLNLAVTCFNQPEVLFLVGKYDNIKTYGYKKLYFCSGSNQQ